MLTTLLHSLLSFTFCWLFINTGSFWLCFYVIHSLLLSPFLNNILKFLDTVVLFSHPVESSSLWPHGLQHARPLCSSPSPEVCPSSCPLHWWCHPTISSSDVHFSFCPQSFPASQTFPMSQLFTSNYQNTRVSTSASVLPTSIQGQFPLRLTGLTLLSKDLSEVFSSTIVRRHQFFSTLPSLRSSSHNSTWPLGRP